MIAWLALTSCGPAPSSPSSADTGGAPVEASWQLDLSDADGGMMLAGWSDGDVLHVVGGHLDRSSASFGGTRWRLSDEGWCVEQQAAPQPLWWIDGRSADDHWVVGEQGLVWHVLGDEVIDETLPTSAKLFGVHDDGTSVWAVGGDLNTGEGEVWRRDAGTWALLATTPGLAFKVWRGWVVGDGFVWQFDGDAPIDRTPASAPRLTTVTGRGDDDVWVVGGLQTPELWHYDGSTWSQPALDPACTGGALNGVVVDDDGTVWVSGMYGVAASLRDGVWDCHQPPLTIDHFHAVARHGDDVLALGGDFLSQGTQHGAVVRYGVGEAAPFLGDCP